jgi:hypothetical protein
MRHSGTSTAHQYDSTRTPHIKHQHPQSVSIRSLPQFNYTQCRLSVYLYKSDPVRRFPLVTEVFSYCFPRDLFLDVPSADLQIGKPIDIILYIYQRRLLELTVFCPQVSLAHILQSE